MGLFIPVKTWQQLILPVIEDMAHFGHLRVLSAFIKGAPQEYISEHLENVTQLVSDDVICYTRKVCKQLSCCEFRNEMSDFEVLLRN